MARAVFLDRDGTINEDVGDLYRAEDLKFIPRAIEALRLLQESFVLFIVTNQSGIGKRVFTREQFLEFSCYYQVRLAQEGISIKRVYCCPHTKEDRCFCRKPSPYFLRLAQNEFGIDLTGSYCIGDHPHDVEMAVKAGAGSIYVLTGHGRRHKAELLIQPDYPADDIYSAASWIGAD